MQGGFAADAVAGGGRVAITGLAGRVRVISPAITPVASHTHDINSHWRMLTTLLRVFLGHLFKGAFHFPLPTFSKNSLSPVSGPFHPPL
jgi:hypothetical protein